MIQLTEIMFVKLYTFFVCHEKKSFIGYSMYIL